MKFFVIIRAVLREIFEESAYERFCAREGVGMGRESYGKFLSETEYKRADNVRCC